MKIDQFNLLLEDTKNLKAEMEMLKNTVKVIADIKQEGKVLKKSVDSLKEEIIQIKQDHQRVMVDPMLLIV